MKIFDSLSRKKSHFLFKDNKVKIFICGPTVYDYCHLGHARIFFFYDLMTRYLLFKGLDPMVIVNLTDIDPKIATRANIQGLSPEALANTSMNYIQIYYHVVSQLPSILLEYQIM